MSSGRSHLAPPQEDKLQSALAKGPSRLSCLYCRKRKVKCDRTKPRCTLCSRSGLDCDYGSKTNMPRSSQIAALEDRVQQLEKLLTAQALLMGPLLAGNDHSIPLRPTITVREASDDEEIIRVVTRSIDMGVGDQTPAALSAFYLDIGRRLLSGDRQQSTQSITCSTPQAFDQGEKRMANIDDKSSPSDSISTASFQQPMLGSGSTFPAGASRPLVTGGLESSETEQGELVPINMMASLIDYYFDKIEPILPLLNRATFESRLADSRSDVRLIINAITAMTLPILQKLSNDFPYSAAQCKTLVEKAIKSTTLAAFQRTDFQVVQALIIVTYASLGQGNRPFAWSLVGLACSQAIRLGLNRDATTSQAAPSPGISTPAAFQPFVLPAKFLESAKDEDEAEERRQAFWQCFILDRICSTGTGWPVLVHRRFFESDLPSGIYGGMHSGKHPSTHSPFRWKPDVSVQQESNSPRLTLWASQKTVTNDGIHDSYRPNRLTELTRSKSLAEFESNGNILSPLAYLCEAFEGLSQVLTFVQQSYTVEEYPDKIERLMEIHASLQAWRDHMSLWDDGVVPHGNIDPVKVQIQAVYHAAMLSLHAPFAFPFEAPPELSPHQPSIRACEQSIKELDWLTRDLKGNLSLMGPFMALYIFLGVRVNLIRCVHCGNGVEGESITRGIDALKELSQMWGLGEHFAGIISVGQNALRLQALDLIPRSTPLAIIDSRVQAFSL